MKWHNLSPAASIWKKSSLRMQIWKQTFQINPNLWILNKSRRNSSRLETFANLGLELWKYKNDTIYLKKKIIKTTFHFFSNLMRCSFSVNSQTPLPSPHRPQQNGNDVNIFRLPWVLTHQNCSFINVLQVASEEAENLQSWDHVSSKQSDKIANCLTFIFSSRIDISLKVVNSTDCMYNDLP